MKFSVARGTKAQVAMEYLIIIGFVAIITIPLVIIFQTHSKETTAEIISSQVYQISKKMADGAETVYYLGEPSKLTIKAYLPAGISSVSIGSNEIVFVVKADIHSQAEINVVKRFADVIIENREREKRGRLFREVRVSNLVDNINTDWEKY